MTALRTAPPEAAQLLYGRGRWFAVLERAP